MGERSELFWLPAIASLAEVIALLSVSEAEQARVPGLPGLVLLIFGNVDFNDGFLMIYLC